MRLLALMLCCPEAWLWQTCWSDLTSAAPASPSQGVEPAFSALCWVPNVPVLLVMDSQVPLQPFESCFVLLLKQRAKWTCLQRPVLSPSPSCAPRHDPPSKLQPLWAPLCKPYAAVPHGRAVTE